MKSTLLKMIKKHLVVVALILLGGCKEKDGQQSDPEMRLKPNVVFIIADDLGWGDVGYNGQRKIKTPNIDRLASEGMVFNRMYAGSTVCGPSRACIITGLHSGHGAVRGNPRWSLSGSPVDINPGSESLGKVMSKAGYHTAAVGKWGLAENLGPAVPGNQGFDYFYGFNKHLPAHHYYPEQIWENDSLIELPMNNTQEKKGVHVQELFTRKAEELIDARDQEPFFLYLAYTTPHFELTIPEEHKVLYDTLNWPLRKMKPGHYLHDTNGHVTYAAMVTKMDDDIGRLVAALKRSGQYENTLLIFTSDNGHEYDDLNNEFFDSNGPFRGRKRDLYEGGIRVPFFAVWPGKIKPGSSTEHRSAFWDIKATLAEIGGVNLDEETDGISFLPVLTGKDVQKKHDYLYWEFNEMKGPVQALVQGDWKLIHYAESGRNELYNMAEDVAEKQDLSEKYPGVTDELLVLLRSARTQHPEWPLTQRPNPWKK